MRSGLCSSSPMSIVYLNGSFQPLAEARVSVLDRGFTFGDGVYEVIPVFNGNIFRLEEHLQRLENSLSLIDIQLDRSREEVSKILHELVQRNGIPGEHLIYLQVTRGVSERNHHYDDGLKPTFFAMCKAISTDDLSAGVSVITADDIRWHRCNIKAITLLPSVLLKRKARDSGGCHEAILIRDGLVTEGASSNVFIVKENVIKTPLKDENVLPGITRDLVVELLNAAGVPCEERDITEDELRHADEVWITSSTIGLVPVINIDGNPVNDGKPGPVWSRTNALYEQFKGSASIQAALARAAS